MGEQINTSSQLNPDVWDAYLHDYWDKQLPLLIRFGFPLDFDRKNVLLSKEDNHSSAQLFPKDIEAYLDEEIKYGAILGICISPSRNLHISAMMTREKPNAPTVELSLT